MNVSCWAFNAG
ncbi:hypothetical protein KVG35_02025 [Escherichia coli]|nr:hypothetical protein [Escherichia coli]